MPQRVFFDHWTNSFENSVFEYTNITYKICILFMFVNILSMFYSLKQTRIMYLNPSIIIMNKKNILILKNFKYFKIKQNLIYNNKRFWNNYRRLYTTRFIHFFLHFYVFGIVRILQKQTLVSYICSFLILYHVIFYTIFYFLVPTIFTTFYYRVGN